MKSMNFMEFEAGLDRVRQLIVGSQLQDFTLHEKEVLLLFYTSKSMVLRLSFKTPPVFFFESENFKLMKYAQKTPLALFLAKYFLRKKVVEVKSQEEWGRKFEIYFQSDEEELFRMEVVLVPGFQNVSLFVGAGRNEKKVHWQKPRPLSEAFGDSKAEVADFRSLDKIREEWYSEAGSTSSKGAGYAESASDWKLDIQKKIKKKTDAIEKILLQNVENEMLVAQLYDLGESLKYKSLDEVSLEERKWIQSQHSRDWNREAIFKKAKSLTAKKEGTRERVGILREEISELNRALQSEQAPMPKHNISIAGKAEVDTRKLEVSSNLSLYIGKNAKDNVQLLKSSQPYELWFHLKDYPSAYAITRKNKTTEVTHPQLLKMATWFVKECFKNKKEKLPGHVEVIYTECRFVKLLKGDRLGRVTYTGTKILRVPTT